MSDKCGGAAALVRCWGGIEFGQDGHGEAEPSTRKLKDGEENAGTTGETSNRKYRQFYEAILEGLPREKIKFIACGASHTVLITGQ